MMGSLNDWKVRDSDTGRTYRRSAVRRLRTSIEAMVNVGTGPITQGGNRSFVALITNGGYR
jgi:hypothetical protein